MVRVFLLPSCWIKHFPSFCITRSYGMKWPSCRMIWRGVPVGNWELGWTIRGHCCMCSHVVHPCSFLLRVMISMLNCFEDCRKIRHFSALFQESQGNSSGKVPLASMIPSHLTLSGVKNVLSCQNIWWHSRCPQLLQKYWLLMVDPFSNGSCPIAKELSFPWQTGP